MDDNEVPRVRQSQPRVPCSQRLTLLAAPRPDQSGLAGAEPRTDGERGRRAGAPRVTAPAWLRCAHPALQSRTEALGVLVAGLSTLVPWAQRLLADEEAAQPAAEDEATQQTARGYNVGCCAALLRRFVRFSCCPMVWTRHHARSWPGPPLVRGVRPPQRARALADALLALRSAAEQHGGGELPDLEKWEAGVRERAGVQSAAGEPGRACHRHGAHAGDRARNRRGGGACLLCSRSMPER